MSHPHETQQQRTAGRHPVDAALREREKYQVVDDWDAMLNQSNVGVNHDKYYVIQLLVDGEGRYYCWTHWGRVGEPGQNSLSTCASLQRAMETFEKKFSDKTGNTWSDRHESISVKGKYTVVGESEAPGPMAAATGSSDETDTLDGVPLKV
jgi:poly [ADP-ribose] polymerase